MSRSRSIIGRRSAIPLLVCCACVSRPVMAASRLFFDGTPQYVADLRAKITQEPYLSMYQSIQAELQPALTTTATVGLEYEQSYEAMNAAYMYLLTGNETYAARARDMSLGLINNNASIGGYWNASSTKGLTRAMMAKGVAIAYDLCKDSSSYAAQKTFISQQLKSNANSLISSGGAGWPGDSRTGNNWWAVRYGAAGLSYLASDETGTDTNLATAYSKLITHLNSNLTTSATAMGWNPEGVGYTQYPWQFTGPFAIAMKRLKYNAAGTPFKYDLLQDGPPATKYTLWATFPGVVAIARPDGVGPGLGIHGDYSDDNPVWDGQGTANLAFAFAPSQYISGMKWQYDRLNGLAGDRTFDANRGGGLFALLYYPDQVAAQNPTQVYGNTYVDPSYGMALFRNGYQDRDDLVAQISARGRSSNGGHSGPDLNSIRIMGLNTAWTTGAGRVGDPRGQTTTFAADPNTVTAGTSDFGTLDSTYTRAAGDGYAVVSGSSTGVYGQKRRFLIDYSKTSGAEGLFLVGDSSSNNPVSGTGIGKFWRLNTPEFNAITLGPVGSGEFTLTSPDGHHMFGRVLAGSLATLRQGTFKRDSATDPNSQGFAYGTQYYQYNNWVDFQSSDGNFLVALSVVRSTDAAPVVAATGSGLVQTVTAGQQTLFVNGTSMAASSWVAWNVDGDGTWGTAANWLFGTVAGAPSGANRHATFGGAITTPRTVSIAAPVTVGTLTLDSAQAYTLTGATITLAVTNGQAHITSSGAAHVIEAPVTLAWPTVLSLGSGPRFGAMTVNAASTLSDGALRVTSLAVGGGAKLDLGAHELVVDYAGASPRGAIEAMVALARNGMDVNQVTRWDGAGLTSTAARVLSAGAGFDLYGVGVLDNAALADPNIGRAPYTAMGGVAIDASSVVARYTYSGDADLNGLVDGDDYALIDNAFNGLIPNFGWMSGDFNYDGLIDGDDYALIDSGFLFQGAPLAGRAVGVPEPGLVGLMAMAGLMGLRRQRVKARA